MLAEAMLGLLASIEPMGYLHLCEIDMQVLHNFVMPRVCVCVLCEVGYWVCA